MKRKFVLHFFTVMFFFIFAFAAGKTYAQAQPQAAPNQRWVCMDAIWCNTTEGFQKCSGKANYKHRVLLSTKKDAKPLPSAETFVIECFTITNQQKCTTGNSTNDLKLFGRDVASELKTAVGYSNQGMFETDGEKPAANPATSSGTGDIGPYEWESATDVKGPNGEAVKVARKWMAVNFYSPNGAGSGNNGGQQQGTLDFQAADKDCVSIAWDPFGTVFDSQSLEPLKGMKVELWTKNSDGQYVFMDPNSQSGLAIVNPQTTTESGQFLFVVPDGTYQLKVTDPTGNYLFPHNASVQIPSSYSSRYANLYPTQTGVDIVQKGVIQRRDIPMDLKSGGTKQASPMPQPIIFSDYVDATRHLIIEGNASYPLAIINVYIQKNGQKVALLPSPIHADSTGYFRFVSKDPLELGVTAQDATLTSEKPSGTARNPKKPSFFEQLVQKIIGQVYAQSQQNNNIAIVHLDIPLNYIDGYAYDSVNKIIPNATVGLYPTTSLVPVYTTKADSTGHFKISSEYIPPIDYILRYTKPNGEIVNASTTTFMKQNNEYISQNKIDLYSYRDKNGNTAKSKVVTGGLKPTEAITQASSQNSNTTLITAVVMFVLLLIVGVGVGVYVMKKNKVSTMGM